MEDEIIAEKSEIRRICKHCQKDYHWRDIWIHERECQKKISPDVISGKVALCKNCGCYSENFEKCCSKKIIAKNTMIQKISDDLPKNEQLDKLPNHIIVVIGAMINGKKAKYWCKLCQINLFETDLNGHIGSKMHNEKIREIEEKKMTPKDESLLHKMENIKGTKSI